MKNYLLLTFQFLWKSLWFTLKTIWLIIFFFLMMIWRILNNSSSSTGILEQSQYDRDVRDYKLQQGKYRNDKRWYE